MPRWPFSISDIISEKPLWKLYIVCESLTIDCTRISKNNLQTNEKKLVSFGKSYFHQAENMYNETW